MASFLLEWIVYELPYNVTAGVGQRSRECMEINRQLITQVLGENRHIV
jgi:hypothetical protein